MSAEPTIEPTRFDRDTALSDLGDGVYEARIDKGWWGMVTPNGGYVAALLATACEAAVAEPERPARSLTVHYLRRITEGPALIRVEMAREGRSLSSLAVRMEQGGEPVALGLAAFSKAWEGSPVELVPEMPKVREPEDLDPVPGELRQRFPPMFSRLEWRPAYGARPFSGAERAELGAWMRLAEGERPIDAPLLAALADACFPAVFAVMERGAGLPTVDMTIHFRGALPLPADWVLGIFRSSLVSDGIVEEDGELWSRDGRLLAQSRQLALVR